MSKKKKKKRKSKKKRKGYHQIKQVYLDHQLSHLKYKKIVFKKI